jgi:hypothetical protein
MNAHILIIADGRSPTARSWINNIQALGYHVSLVSTFPCDPPIGIDHFFTLPIALSRFSKDQADHVKPSNEQASPKSNRSLIRRFAPHLQSLRYILGPLTLPIYALAYQKLVRELNPNLVHALRIPFEGMLGSYTPPGIPFLASTWGNDLTLHASGSPLMRAFTKRCLSRADGLIADTRRDTRLAHTWGLPDDSPTLVVPGSGGLDVASILSAEGFDPASHGIPIPSSYPKGHRQDPSQCDWVVNPRGQRPASIHQDVFFGAIPAILAERPHTHFICPSLAGNHQAQAWVDAYAVGDHTHLLPKLPQNLLWSLLKNAQLYVSPSSHDGTPNSLLEAMACGCFPVVGDIESLREWIEHGVNGLLVNPLDAHDLAEAILSALASHELRKNAAEFNQSLVRGRADQSATLPRIDAFYRQFLP